MGLMLFMVGILTGVVGMIFWPEITNLANDQNNSRSASMRSSMLSMRSSIISMLPTLNQSGIPIDGFAQGSKKHLDKAIQTSDTV